MSTQKELQTWNSAHEAFIQQNYTKSLELYQEISYLSKISFNVGSIYLFLDDYLKALDSFTSSIQSDEYLLISLFQRGNCYFTVGELELASQDYTSILKLLKENMNYTQLGIEYELYMTEVLFNRALCYMGIGLKDKSLEDLEKAKTHADPRHLQALMDFGWESRIFMVKGGLQFQIPKYKLQESKKWLKNAESVKCDSNFLGFLGSTVVNPKNVFYTESRGKSVVRKEASGSATPSVAGNTANDSPLSPSQVVSNNVRNSLPLPPPRPLSPAPSVNILPNAAMKQLSPSIVVRNSLPVHLSRSVAPAVPVKVLTTPESNGSVAVKGVPVSPTNSSRILSMTSNRSATSKSSPLSQDQGGKSIYVASFVDNSGSITLRNTLGIFQRMEDAEDACKEFIDSALGEIDARGVNWIEGWEKGDFCVSVSIQKLR